MVWFPLALPCLVLGGAAGGVRAALRAIVDIWRWRNIVNYAQRFTKP